MAKDRVRRTLQRLSEAVGVPGFEEEPRQLIQMEIENLVHKMWVDPLGNLLAIRNGDSNHPRILLDAHVDEIGFLVKYIHKEGFLRITPIGGWDQRILPGQQVVIQPRMKGEFRRIYGVIGAMPPHVTTAKQREEIIPIEGLFVDIGVSSKEAAEDLGLRIGTPLTVWQPFLDLPNDVVSGKAFDDRVGCVVLIEVLRRLADKGSHLASVVFNFATAEEVGGRGARTGAYTLEPDVALAIECTTAADLPGVDAHKVPTHLGKGPALTVADRSLVTHPHVLETLERVAIEHNITWQYKQPLIGGTDGGPISVSRGGIPTGVVSVPCRYIHSAISLLRLPDLMATINLVYEFIHAWAP